MIPSLSGSISSPYSLFTRHREPDHIGDTGDQWAFLEGRPAGGGETFTNACDKWFCNAAKFNHSGTKVFAIKYARCAGSSCAESCYPMAWDAANKDVAGVDRSGLYEAAC